MREVWNGTWWSWSSPFVRSHSHTMNSLITESYLAKSHRVIFGQLCLLLCRSRYLPCYRLPRGVAPL
jgi:hypothetical protein